MHDYIGYCINITYMTGARRGIEAVIGVGREIALSSSNSDRDYFVHFARLALEKE